MTITNPALKDEQYRYYPNDEQSEFVTIKRGSETIKKPFIAKCPICSNTKPGFYYLFQGNNSITSCHGCREKEYENVWKQKAEEISVRPIKTPKPVMTKDDIINIEVANEHS